MDDEKDFEEKKNNFLEMLGMISAANRSREENIEQELEHMSINIAKMHKRWFDSFVAVGFNDNQALDLTKNIMNTLTKGVFNGDK